MFLLVTTPLQIILEDVGKKTSSVIRTGDGYYFGISHSQGNFVLVTARFLQYFSRKTKPFFSKTLMKQAHQIEWVEDKVLVADTGNNSLAVFNNQGKFLERIYFNEIKQDDKDLGRTGNHFNSVHRVRDRVYVVAHNYEKPSEVWVLSWPELKILEKIVTKAAWAHNVWECEWGLVICDSRHGSLYDVISGETIWKSDEPKAFTRGLAATKDFIFVGCSVYQERKERYWKSGKVWILDRKTLRMLDEIPLPGSGDVQELRIVGEIDECHNGEVIEKKGLETIRRRSLIIQASYRLRQKYPALQREVFLLSQLVRGVQILPRWQKTIKSGISQDTQTQVV